MSVTRKLLGAAGIAAGGALLVAAFALGGGTAFGQTPTGTGTAAATTGTAVVGTTTAVVGTATEGTATAAATNTPVAAGTSITSA